VLNRPCEYCVERCVVTARPIYIRANWTVILIRYCVTDYLVCEMPMYSKHNVAELKQICASRGLVFTGLNKRGIIAMITDDDRRIEREGDGNDVEGDDVSDGAGNDDQRSDGESIAGFSSMPVAVGDDSPETDSVRVMQLKLALVREERERERERDERARLAREREFQIEKERLCLRDSRGPTPMHPVRPEVHNILPKMSNDDPLVFFQSFERALLLNDVAKSQWSRYLLANLTQASHSSLNSLNSLKNLLVLKCPLKPVTCPYNP